MTPPERLVELLATARRTGVDFDEAWRLCTAQALDGIEGVEHRDWTEALSGTRSAWEEAWERQPATRRQRALVAVADDPERIPLEHEGDVCGYCDAPLPAGRDPRRVYCDATCRKRASAARVMSRAA